jgi:hypothetical protein
MEILNLFFVSVTSLKFLENFLLSKLIFVVTPKLVFLKRKILYLLLMDEKFEKALKAVHNSEI